MPDATERDVLIAKKKRLQEELKALPGHVAFLHPDNAELLPKKQAKLASHIDEIDARLNQLEQPKK